MVVRVNSSSQVLAQACSVNPNSSRQVLVQIYLVKRSSNSNPQVVCLGRSNLQRVVQDYLVAVRRNSSLRPAGFLEAQHNSNNNLLLEVCLEAQRSSNSLRQPMCLVVRLSSLPPLAVLCSEVPLNNSSLPREGACLEVLRSNSSLPREGACSELLQHNSNHQQLVVCLGNSQLLEDPLAHPQLAQGVYSAVNPRVHYLTPLQLRRHLPQPVRASLAKRPNSSSNRNSVLEYLALPLAELSSVQVQDWGRVRSLQTH